MGIPSISASSEIRPQNPLHRNHRAVRRQFALLCRLIAVWSITGYWAKQAFVESGIAFWAVAQTVGFEVLI
jgi:hypothetical protein